MQYILSEEEMKIYKRCKTIVETDYEIFTRQENINKISDFALEKLKWGLGLREDFPKFSERYNINNALVNDIVEKVKSKDYCHKGFGYNNHGYSLSAAISSSIWKLTDRTSNVVMEFNFANNKIQYVEQDKNALEITKKLQTCGWHI